MSLPKILLATCLAAFAVLVHAQDFPARAVRVVVPYPPGGGVDGLARPLAERLSRLWNQPVVVDNRAGAATQIGGDAVAKAAPDGHTLLLTTDSTITSNPHLYPKMPFDPIRDLAPVTQLIDLHQMVVAHPSVGASSMQELVALARAKPGALNYGSYGSGSQPHLLFEALKAQTGVQIAHIPYKGIAPALTAAIAGEVQLTLGGAATTRGHFQTGRLKPLAIARQERLPLYPDVPTLREAGFPDVDPRPWFGVFAPAATPRAVIERIRRDIAAVLAEPEFREREITGKGYTGVGNTPEEFAAFIRADLEMKGRLIRVSGAKAE
ncbi:MAG: tripartite tricarboxylate transporter substrate binding protein [Burkholderiales bacterium]|nr:tripartite tricarboxylate transporter substrate binding protein [Burkholderiales bacterium]